MNIVVEPENRDAVLKRFHGLSAKLWAFHVTLNRLALILFDSGNKEALYLVAVGVESICGPTAWRAAKPVIVASTIDSGEIMQKIVDSTVGFEVVCSDVTLVIGEPGVFRNPFDGWLDE